MYIYEISILSLAFGRANERTNHSCVCASFIHSFNQWYTPVVVMMIRHGPVRASVPFPDGCDHHDGHYHRHDDDDPGVMVVVVVVLEDHGCDGG